MARRDRRRSADRGRCGNSLDREFHVERWDGAASLRTVLLHLIHEYARHNGHADLLREGIDGVVGG